MIQLDLTPDEQTILAEALASYLSGLSTEIAHTDRVDFRDDLKNRQRVIQKIVSTLTNTGNAS